MCNIYCLPTGPKCARPPSGDCTNPWDLISLRMTPYLIDFANVTTDGEAVYPSPCLAHVLRLLRAVADDALRLAVARRRGRGESLKIAEFGMAAATIADKEGDEIAHAPDVGAIDDRTPFLGAFGPQAGARQNGEVCREGVVRRGNSVRNGAGGKTLRVRIESEAEKLPGASADRAPPAPPAHARATYCPWPGPAPRG